MIGASKLAMAAAMYGVISTSSAAVTRAEPSASRAPSAKDASHSTHSTHGAAKIPEALAVPEGNRLAFEYDAQGVQIYRCSEVAGGGPAWALEAPEAELRTKNGHVAGTHFKGPAWKASDGSTVVGAKLQAANGDATAVPWLLLQATSHEGAGRMSKVSFIQRLHTRGGLAPTSGCDAAHSGQTVRVPYSARYAFYEPMSGNSTPVAP